MRFFPTFGSAHRLCLQAKLGCWLAVVLTLAATSCGHAALSATFNAASDVPMTATSYTASGEVDFTLNFTPEPGTNLTVVKNTGVPFISGTFSNLTNGATVNLSYEGITYPFVAWYYGGEGNNDLVLLWARTMISGWGTNFLDQLADIGSSSMTYPGLVDGDGVLEGKTLVQVSSGTSHTLALTTEGKVYSWGSNLYGELGRETGDATSRSPAAIMTNGQSALAGKTVVAVAAGDFLSLALCSDGTVCSWGFYSPGSLGRSGDPTIPGAVEAGSASSALHTKTVTAISVGSGFSLALCSDGTLTSWGSNNDGQLGTGTAQSYYDIPVAVSTSAGQSALAGKIVTAISAGTHHALALCSDGTVAAWGSNSYGQLGNGTGTNHAFPVAVATAQGQSYLHGKTVTAIAAGNSHSLALCSDGRIAAWGQNEDPERHYGYGRLGIQYSMNAPMPAPVSVAEGQSALFGKTVKAIATGKYHSLALLTDGTVAVWGYSFDATLGIPAPSTLAPSPTLVDTTPGRSALAGQQVSWLAQFSSKTVSSMVIVPGGPPDMRVSARTSASTYVGIADGDMTPGTEDLTNFGDTPIYPAPAPAERTFYISNLGLEPLMLTGQPRVTLSGANAADFEVITPPSSTRVPWGSQVPFTIRLTPSAPGLRTAVVSIASSDADAPNYEFAIQGKRTDLEMNAEFNSSTTPAHTANGFTAGGRTLNVTLNFAPAPGTNLTVIENTARSFIEGSFVNLTNGATVNLTHNGVTYPFVAWYYGGEGNNDLVLLWQGTSLVAWGANDQSQITGGDTVVTSPRLAAASGLLAGKTIVQVAQGKEHSLALTTEGKVYAWGSGNYGKLGLALHDSLNYSSPQAVNTTEGLSSLFGKTVIALAAGEHHSLALCSDGTVSSWGLDTSGQMGSGDGFQRRVPGMVLQNTPNNALSGRLVCAIAAGREHSLALCTDGTLVAWGSNAEGQLGTPTIPIKSSYAVRVSTSHHTSDLYERSVTAISAGAYHNLVLCSDGSVIAWGDNNSGQLGQSLSNYSANPVRVSTTPSAVPNALFGKTVKAVSAGWSHSVALCTDGTVATWGLNDSGQLGNGSTSLRSSPGAVNTAPGTSALAGKTVVAVSASAYHNVALCSDGTLAAWGDNAQGQLGDGTQTSRLVPVQVNALAGASPLAGQTVTSLAAGSNLSRSSMVTLPATPRDLEVSGHALNDLNGDSVAIANGDVTPTPDDGTFLGATLPNSGIFQRFFRLRNRGLEDLALTGSPFVTISGTHAADFSLSPSFYNAALTVPPGKEIILMIQFKPTGLGLRTARVTIASDDPDESPYEFTIAGTGIGPDIEIRESGVELAANATVAFGNVGINKGAVQKTFTLHNAGTLELTGVTLSRLGMSPQDFTVITPPDTAVLPGESTSFTVQATPSSAGLQSAILRISSSSVDEPQFDLHLTAHGVNPVAPAVDKETATDITFESATLRAEVKANGSERQVFFDYGTTPQFGIRVATTPTNVTGSTATNVSAALSGLTPNTKYYYRIFARGERGSVTGSARTFTTLNRLPVAVADSAVVLPAGQVVIPVLANDVDPGDVLSIASFTQPPPTVGKVTKVGNTLVFTAAAGFAGGTFGYVAGDAFKGTSNPATVTLTLGTCSIGPDVTIPANSPPYELAVTTNAPFGIIENTSWLSFVPPAANATSVTFIATPNASKTARTAIVMIGGKTHTVTQSGVSAVPVLTVPPFIPQAAISANYELAILTQNGPVTYTATNLPKGLTLSNATGKITGYPTEAKTSSVTVKAKNVQGDSSSISFNITVLDIPASVVGSFSALVEDDTALTDKLGGFMTMTVTKTGGVTGTLKLGAGSHPFTGRLNTAETPAAPDPLHAVLRTSVKRAGRPNVELLVRMNDDETDLISGEVTLAGAEPASLELEGSRHVWDAKTKPADNYQGYYTVALQPTSTAADIPQGDGFLTMTVTPAGAVSWFGQLADGTVMPAQTCTLWADGRVPLFIVFGKGLGSLTQSLTISSETRLVTGPLRWHKKPQVVRAYADGFENATLQASGGKYVPPGPNKTILGLNAPALVNLDFKSGGIEDASQFVPSISFSISTQHQGSRPAEGNPAQIKLTKIDVVKGTYMGTMTLKDPNPFNASLPQVSRPVTFQGVLVPHLNFSTGYFLLPAIAGPPVDVTKSPTLSGRVQITPMP